MKYFLISTIPENPYKDRKLENSPYIAIEKYKKRLHKEAIEIDTDKMRFELSQKIADRRFVGTCCVQTIRDTLVRSSDVELADLCISFVEDFIKRGKE